jgi:hypothetical protein
MVPGLRHAAGRARRRSRAVLGRLGRATPRGANPRAHYDRFERRGNTSGARYEVPRATFPVTLGLAERSTAAELWRTRVARLDVVQLTGTHNGLLLPPDVTMLAEQMAVAFGLRARSG